MLDLNRTPSPERQEDQGRQSKKPRDESSSRSSETSSERFERNMRFLRTTSESSIQQVGPCIVDQSHFETPEQVRENQEQQAIIGQKKKRKYEWKSQESRENISQKRKKKWEDTAYRENINQKRKEQWENLAYREKRGQKRKEKWKDPTCQVKMIEVLKKNSEKKWEKFLDKKFKGNQAKIEAAKRLREKKQT